MHMQGEPRTMQADPRYEDVVSEVAAFLEQRAAFAVAEGVAPERIQIDPGIGFGKTIEHNLELLARLRRDRRPRFSGRHRPLAQALPRRADRPEVAAERVAASVAGNVLAYERGASVFRVHDVAETVDGLRVAAGTLRAMQPERQAKDESHVG